MSPAATTATARRVVLQLRHDPRTIALLVLVPVVLITLLKYEFAVSPRVFQRIGPELLGIFPLITMFVVASIATLRERTSGTLERLLTLRTGKLDLLLGYLAAFTAVAVVQVAVVVAIALGPLGLTVAGDTTLLVILALLNAILGTASGLFLSSLAHTEFQAVQFLPAFILPQLLVCGLFTPFETMPRWLQLIADALPLHYAVEGLSQAVGPNPGNAWRDIAIVAGCCAIAIVLGATTLRRRTP